MSPIQRMAYKKTAGPQGQFRTWSDSMEGIYARVGGLDGAYRRLLTAAGHVKELIARGESAEKKIAEMQQILNTTLPIDDADRTLASFLNFLAKDRREELFSFLFKTKRACLLLLVDGAVARSLYVANQLEISLDDKLQYRVTLRGNMPDKRRGRAPQREQKKEDAKPAMKMEDIQKILTGLAAPAPETQEEDKKVHTSWLDDEDIEELIES